MLTYDSTLDIPYVPPILNFVEFWLFSFGKGKKSLLGVEYGSNPHEALCK